MSTNRYDAPRGNPFDGIPSFLPPIERSDAERLDAVTLAERRNAYEQANRWRGPEWLKANPFKEQS